MRSESLSQCFQLKDFARLVVAGGGCGCRRDKARLCGARIVSSKYKYLSLLTPQSSQRTTNHFLNLPILFPVAWGAGLCT